MELEGDVALDVDLALLFGCSGVGVPALVCPHWEAGAVVAEVAGIVVAWLQALELLLGLGVAELLRCIACRRRPRAVARTKAGP